ncbi:ATP-binding cassette domain-containing protein [Humibacter sp.]|uniref:ABC transporter ATP-binding protein n=1 Tax=Humibacter sp. TaxID=1940291 RepID=UPI003F82100B
MQDDPQTTIAGGAQTVSGTDSSGSGSSSDAPVVGTRGAKPADARRSGRPRATGAAAGTSVVADAAAGEPAAVVTATAPRGPRGSSRARGTATRATKGTAIAASSLSPRSEPKPLEATPAVSKPTPRAEAPSVETERPAVEGAPPEAGTTSTVLTATEVADTVQRTGTKSEHDDVDTGPMPVHSATVDENTGSRQRITLFGRRRRAAAAAAAAAEAEQETQDDGSDLLAELVRETEASDSPPAAQAIEQAEPADRAEALTGSASEVEFLQETVDRSTLARKDDLSAVDAAEPETVQPARARRAAETRVFPPARPAPPTTAPVVLAVTGLHKRYGDVVAVDGVNLSIRAGSMYGIVGPNGAGKTTTLSIITGLLRADSGAVYVNGVDARKNPRAAKRAIGVLPDHLRTFDKLTGAQLLYYAGTLRGLDAPTTRQRSADLAAAFGIEDAMGRLVADYSAGMTKKVSLAAAMIHSPRLLVLDEPFEGVDPVSAATVTGILQRYVDAGGTVLLSSHGMDLVQRICDSVAIIVGGVVLDSGPVDEVRGEKTLEEHFIELAGGRKAVEGLEWLHSFSD